MGYLGYQSVIGNLEAIDQLTGHSVKLYKNYSVVCTLHDIATNRNNTIFFSSNPHINKYMLTNSSIHVTHM